MFVINHCMMLCVEAVVNIHIPSGTGWLRGWYFSCHLSHTHVCTPWSVE